MARPVNCSDEFALTIPQLSSSSSAWRRGADTCSVAHLDQGSNFPRTIPAQPW
ncbi:MAG TPA: hypothetical protein VNK04_08620 [Gemmataceae bacterium]|nr:hypothetical protein [Gemmataceae bacterium]